MIMMWRRDLMSINLNSPATPVEEVYGGGAGAAMEAMRQAILHHDAVFKHQVSELHRLYWTQKSLMSELCRYNPEPVGLMRSLDLRLPVDAYGMRDSGEEGLLLPRREVWFSAGKPAIGFDSDHRPASTMERWDLSNQGSAAASLWHDDRSSSPSPPLAGLNDAGVAPPFNVFPIKMQSAPRVPIDLNEAIDVEILPDLVAEHNISDESGSLTDQQLVLFSGVSRDQSLKGSILTCHHDASSSIPRCPTGSRGSLSSSIRYYSGETTRTTVHNSGGYVAGENSRAWPVHGDRNQRSLSSEGSAKRADAPGGHRNVESSDLGTSISVESHTTFLAVLDGDAGSKPDLASEEAPDRSSNLSIGGRNSVVLADNMNQGSHSSVCGERKASLTGHSGDQQMEEEDEMEAMIFKASQILLHMSLHGESKASEEEPPPRHSSDTFEAMTLMLPECKDYGFPSPGGELNDPPPCKDTGNTRLRRGRWLPDFRKDILPGLVSLSRHEIREDLHNLRQAGDATRDKGSCWFVPIGGRRSRRAAAATRS